MPSSQTIPVISRQMASYEQTESGRFPSTSDRCCAAYYKHPTGGGATTRFIPNCCLPVHSASQLRQRRVTKQVPECATAELCNKYSESCKFTDSVLESSSRWQSTQVLASQGVLRKNESCLYN